MQWKKEKWLNMSYFSFFNSVFKRLALQTPNDMDLFGKRLQGEIGLYLPKCWQKLVLKTHILVHL